MARIIFDPVLSERFYIPKPYSLKFSDRVYIARGNQIDFPLEEAKRIVKMLSFRVYLCEFSNV